MRYIEVKLTINPFEDGKDLVMALLGEIGYESFAEDGGSLLSYCTVEIFDELDLKKVLNDFLLQNFKIEYSITEIEEQNWNAVWESNYESVEVEDIVRIRAPFHVPDPNFKHEIVIEPKMSFGTAHHSTTWQMLKLVFQEDNKGKKVMDMGCGTGVLAIFSSMLGAEMVDAVDYDSWAYENTVENIERNNIHNVNAFHGDATYLSTLEPDFKYDIFIANINRNILIADLQHYAKHIAADGVLLMSGFYEVDIQFINAEAEKFGLKLNSYIVRNEWVAGKWTF